MIKPYLLLKRAPFSQSLMFGPEYIIFVEMNILKTLKTVRIGY